MFIMIISGRHFGLAEEMAEETKKATQAVQKSAHNLAKPVEQQQGEVAAVATSALRMRTRRERGYGYGCGHGDVAAAAAATATATVAATVDAARCSFIMGNVREAQAQIPFVPSCQFSFMLLLLLLSRSSGSPSVVVVIVVIGIVCASCVLSGQL